MFLPSEILLGIGFISAGGRGDLHRVQRSMDEHDIVVMVAGIFGVRQSEPFMTSGVAH